MLQKMNNYINCQIIPVDKIKKNSIMIEDDSDGEYGFSVQNSLTLFKDKKLIEIESDSDKEGETITTIVDEFFKENNIPGEKTNPELKQSSTFTNIKRKIIIDDDNEKDENWPLYLGSLVFFLENNQKYLNLKIGVDPLNDYISKNSKNKYRHYFKPKPAFIISDGIIIESIHHLLDGIWQILINFKLVELEIQNLDRENIKIDVFLTKNTSLKNFGITKELLLKDHQFQSNYGVYDDKAQDLRQHELIKYCRESILILIDILKVKKTLDPLIFIKKVKAMKSSSWGERFFPRIYIESSYAEEYYGNKGVLIENRLNYKIITNENTDILNEEKNMNKNKCENFDSSDEDLEDSNEEDLEENYEESKENHDIMHYLDSNKFQLHEPASGMTTHLYEFQKQALNWCLFREGYIEEKYLYKNGNMDENFRKINLFSEEYELLNKTYKSHIYLNVLTGQVSLDKKDNYFCKGGILADEMGLGKTIITLALIHTHKGEKIFSIVSKNSNSKKLKVIKNSQKTLIITPMSIINQWKDEIVKHSKKNSLKVLIFYGNSRNNMSFEDYDLVLTTYDILSQEYKKLLKGELNSKLLSQKWFRVVLDEAHNIKNFRSLRAEACYSLNAENRWCLTGTPIQNNLDDLYSLLKFIRIEHFSDNYRLWNTYIKSDINNINILKHIAGPVLLRRIKCTLDNNGTPFLKLAGKTVIIMKINMEKDERQVYEELFHQSSNKFILFLKNGVALKNYSGIFAMLMKLRQCCDHPSLILKKIENQEIEQRLKEFLYGTTNFDKDEENKFDETSNQNNNKFKLISSELFGEIIQRIKNENFAECPICLSDIVEPTISRCSHILCYECFKRSIDLNHHCPLCRTQLAEYDLTKIYDK